MGGGVGRTETTSSDLRHPGVSAPTGTVRVQVAGTIHPVDPHPEIGGPFCPGLTLSRYHHVKPPGVGLKKAPVGTAVVLLVKCSLRVNPCLARVHGKDGPIVADVELKALGWIGQVIGEHAVPTLSALPRLDKEGYRHGVRPEGIAIAKGDVPGIIAVVGHVSLAQSQYRNPGRIVRAEDSGRSRSSHHGRTIDVVPIKRSVGCRVSHTVNRSAHRINLIEFVVVGRLQSLDGVLVVLGDCGQRDQSAHQKHQCILQIPCDSHLSLHSP